MVCEIIFYLKDLYKLGKYLKFCTREILRVLKWREGSERENWGQNKIGNTVLLCLLNVVNEGRVQNSDESLPLLKKKELWLIEEIIN